MGRLAGCLKQWILAGTFASMCGATTLMAQDSVPTYVRDHYTRREYGIPMRDGVKLRTIVFSPNDTAIPYPILLTRTPYGADTYFNPLGPAESFARAGYIIAFQDVRGKYLSEGTFVDVPPYHVTKRLDSSSARNIDESTDTYDTIDWLVRNAPHNNGRVGQYGISYLGYYSTMGILSGHPALKAVSPQAPVTDWFVGDDFHHNGALFLADAFDFEAGFGVYRPQPTNDRSPGLRTVKPDEYRFFLEDVGPLPNVNAKFFHHEGRVLGLDHRASRRMMRSGRPAPHCPHLHDVKPAVMVVGGWFDAEDLWGTLAVYRTIAADNPTIVPRLVMGPWFHAGWFLTDGGDFADIQFPTKTANDYHAQVELPFFEHYLKDKGDLAPFQAFVYETGADQWRTFDSWPPKGTTTKAFYFRTGGQLATTAPSTTTAGSYDQYVSDPAKPVPYMSGVQDERPAEYMASDQRFASERPDVVVYRSAPLAEDLTIAGPITARLYVSTTGTDADWVVKLIDVYPDDTPDPKPNPREIHLGGYEQLVRAEVMRGKFRHSLEHPEPFVPNMVTPVEFTLPDALHRFKKGHRLMVQVQSSWFPLVDRNPQRFVDIYQATAADFQTATQRIYHTAAASSQITLTILP